MFDEQFPVYSIYLNFSADFMIYKQMFEFDSFCNRTIIIVTAHTITGVSWKNITESKHYGRTVCFYSTF